MASSSNAYTLSKGKILVTKILVQVLKEIKVKGKKAKKESERQIRESKNENEKFIKDSLKVLEMVKLEREARRKRKSSHSPNKS